MKPRLACRLARTWSALRESTTSPHLATCPDCQAHLHASGALDGALRREAVVTTPVLPAGLERGILDAIRRARHETAEPAETIAYPWRSLVTFGTVAAVLVLGSVVFHRAGFPFERSGNPTPADAQALVETVGSFSEKFVETVLPSAGTMIADNPLQTEINAVYSDAKSALDFLALNFLPRTAPANAKATQGRTG